MSLIRELRVRARHVLFPAAGLAVVIYFVWHGINGERGYLAWRNLQQEISLTRAERDQVRGEREVLERRVHLLYPQTLDPDMLDESARRLLSFGLPDEIIIQDPPPR